MMKRWKSMIITKPLMIRYIKTIGYIEPSYVIRKFLDAQRLPNLTSYLEALHQQGVANSEHTTFLLKCYSKLKEKDKLKEFVYNEKNSFPSYYNSLHRFEV